MIGLRIILAWFALGAVVFLSSLTGCHYVEGGNHDDRPSAPTFIHSAAYHSDGNWLVVDFYGLTYSGISLIDRQGRVVKWLCESNKDYDCSWPAYSPKGDQIAFSFGKTNKYSNIYIVNHDATGIRRLTNNRFRDGSPVFSHDGRKLYFSRHKRVIRSKMVAFVQGDIYCIDLDTNQEYQVTNEDHEDLLHMSILPGDGYAVFSSGKMEFEFLGHNLIKQSLYDAKERFFFTPDLTEFAADPNTTGRGYDRDNKKFFDTKYVEIKHPAVSRDGRFMAFSWNNPNQKYRPPQVYVTDLETRRTRKVTEFVNGALVRAISPDGGKILVQEVTVPNTRNAGPIKRTHLWGINRDGSGARNFTLDFRGVAGQKPALTPENMP